MFGLLIALAFLGSVICYYDNTIKDSPNGYINANARSKRDFYINGIPAEDYGRYTEYVKSSTPTNVLRSSTPTSVLRSVRSTEKNNAYNDKNADVSSIGNLATESRWDIVDWLLNRQDYNTDQEKSSTRDSPNTADSRWDILDILDKDKLNSDSEQNKADANSNKNDFDSIDPDKLSRFSVGVTPGQWKKISISFKNNTVDKVDSISGESVAIPTNKTEKPEDKNKNNLRWLLNGGNTQNNVDLDNDYDDFDVIEYLINDYISKHPEAKYLQRKPKRKRNRRHRRFNVNQDLLNIQPPTDLRFKSMDEKPLLESPMVELGSGKGLAVKNMGVMPLERPRVEEGSGRDLFVKNNDVKPLESRLVEQGSGKYLSGNPFENTPLTDEEEKCTKATNGVIDASSQSRDIHMYLDNDQSTGTVHIDTRRVCKEAYGLSVKACDQVRPYVFLIPHNTTKFEYNIMVVRIQPKQIANVAITISCPGI